MIRCSHLMFGACLFVTGMHHARADLPFLKSLAGDTELPGTYGIGIDLLRLRQDYAVQNVEIGLPGLVIPDPSVLDVNSRVDFIDIKLDAWVFPFLNVFGIIGALDGDTTVDLSAISLPQLPVPLGSVDIDYDGSVFGAGFTSVYGTDRWFASLTATYTDTSLDGDFTSTVETISLQPRIGKRYTGGAWWVGATYLNSEEEHSGVIDLGIPNLPALPFDVELESSEEWNLNVGAQVEHNKNIHTLLEVGFSDRIHVLANLTWRF